MAWEVGPEEVEAIALGAGILGTGGGGNPYLGKLHLLQELRDGRRVRMIDPAEVRDDAVLIAVSGMGAPTVTLEKLAWGRSSTRRSGRWSATPARRPRRSSAARSAVRTA